MGVLVIVAHAFATTSEQPKTNIIYILADDLGYGDLGCYGQQNIRTPELDQMAAQGMRFTQHYSGSTVCAPSRSVLMTGLHTGHTRVRGNARVPLRPQDITVAELLSDAGYATGLIGKWGLGEAGTTGHPNSKGFDTFFGYLNQRHAHNYYPEFLWRNREKVQLRNEVDPGSASGLGGVSTNKLDYSHDLFTDEALSFIKRNRDQPFFLYLAYTIPHANNEARNKGMEVPDFGIYSDEDWPDPQKGHAAMITRMDRDIGNILDMLGELGIDHKTLVLFSSDNGPHQEGGNDPAFNDSNGPLRGIKRSLHEGGIRVPMLAWWPGTIEAGHTSDHISAFWDLLPTACELAGIKPPAPVDGISFLPELLASPQKEHDYLYWEFTERGGSQAIRQGNWKAVRKQVNNNPDAPVELYDLSRDLSESDNIAESHPEVVAEMRELFSSARSPSSEFPLLYHEVKN